MRPDLGQQFLLGGLAGLEPAVAVPDIPAMEDEHRATSRPTWSAPEKKPSFPKGEDYLAVPPTLVRMPVCRDLDDDGRNVPIRMARAAERLPRSAQSKDPAILDPGSGNGRGTAALTGYDRAVPANHRKPFIGGRPALCAGSSGTVEVPMTWHPAVADCP